jgi:hypothetical protein
MASSPGRTGDDDLPLSHSRLIRYASFLRVVAAASRSLPPLASADRRGFRTT